MLSVTNIFLRNILHIVFTVSLTFHCFPNNICGAPSKENGANPEIALSPRPVSPSAKRRLRPGVSFQERLSGGGLSSPYYGRCITGGSEAAALSFRGFGEPSFLLKFSFSNRTSYMRLCWKNICALWRGFTGGLFSPGPLDANTCADLSSPRPQGVTVNQG